MTDHKSDVTNFLDKFVWLAMSQNMIGCSENLIIEKTQIIM